MNQKLGKASIQSDSFEEKVEFPPYLVWSLGLAVLGLNIFAYGVNFGIGVGLFHLCLLWATVLAFRTQGRRPLVYLLAVIGSTAAVLVSFRANGFVQAVNLVTVWVVWVALLLLRSISRIQWQVWNWLKSLKNFVFQLPYQVGSLAEYSSHPKAEGKIQLVAILKSVSIAFLVLLFFASLLSAADPIFAEIARGLRGEIIGRVVTSLLLTLVLTVLLTNKVKPGDAEPPELRFLSFQDIAISITGLLLLFAFFLAIQAKYLFASHADFQSFNLTYSEYVRKGFFELIFATFFASLIGYVNILKQQVATTKQVDRLKIINIVLIIELACLLVSALKRDLMYIEVYGLTRTRIIGEVFLAWVGGLLILLFLLNSWRQFKEKQFLAGLGIVSLLVVGFLNIFNMDQHIAEATPSRHRQKRDLFYLSILSEDACQGWEESIIQAQAIFTTFKDKTELNEEEQSQLANLKLAMIALQEKRIRLEEKYGGPKTVGEEFLFLEEKELPRRLQRGRKWQSFNLSQYLAYQKMQANKDLFYSQLNQLIQTIEDYQKTNNIDLYEAERWILYDFQYPFVNLRFDYSPANSILKESSLPKPLPSDHPLSPIQD